MRRVGRETCQREAQVLEVLSWEAFEDYLGVALIRSGRHRYRQNEAGGRLVFPQKGWNRENFMLSSLLNTV